MEDFQEIAFHGEGGNSVFDTGCTAEIPVMEASSILDQNRSLKKELESSQHALHALLEKHVEAVRARAED